MIAVYCYMKYIAANRGLSSSCSQTNEIASVVQTAFKSTISSLSFQTRSIWLEKVGQSVPFVLRCFLTSISLFPCLLACLLASSFVFFAFLFFFLPGTVAADVDFHYAVFALALPLVADAHSCLLAALFVCLLVVLFSRLLRSVKVETAVSSFFSGCLRSAVGFNLFRSRFCFYLFLP